MRVVVYLKLNTHVMWWKFFDVLWLNNTHVIDTFPCCSLKSKSCDELQRSDHDFLKNPWIVNSGAACNHLPSASILFIARLLFSDLNFAPRDHVTNPHSRSSRVTVAGGHRWSALEYSCCNNGDLKLAVSKWQKQCRAADAAGLSTLHDDAESCMESIAFYR